MSPARRSLAEKTRLDRDLLDLLACSAENRYARRFLPRPGRPPRVIDAPDEELKFVQKEIYHRFLRWIPPSKQAHGFVPGRSIVTNALPHTGKALVLNLDIRDFFPSVTAGAVLATGGHLGLDETDAARLRDLCTLEGRLPQGAPTSPALANLACRRLDARLNGLARSLDLDYTRYADDMTFSGARIHQAFMGQIRTILDESGFTLAEEKTRLMRRSTRQLVTGLVVNDGVALPRPLRHRFRAILHDAGRQGLEAALAGRSRDWLLGHLAQMAAVHPDEARGMIDAVMGLAAPRTDG